MFKDYFINPMVLHEDNNKTGKYDLPNSTSNINNDDQQDDNSDSDNTTKDENNAELPNDNKYDLADDSDNTTDTTGDDTTNNDGKYDLTDANDNITNNDTNSDNSNMTDDNQNNSEVPEIKILNLSERDKQLNNLRLLKQFQDLYSKMITSIDEIAKRTYTVSQQIIVDKVLDELNDLTENLKTIITLNYTSSYEQNMVTYLTYLKAYRIAVGIMRKLYDMSNDTDTDNKNE